MRLSALLVTGILLTGAVAACSGGSGNGGAGARTAGPVHRVVDAAPETVVHDFAAYRADGTPAVGSDRTEDGYCWDSSLAASGPEAFRCFVAGAGGQILDPCFAPATAHPTGVLCVDDPWSRATTLRLTRALPAAVTGVLDRPWALQLVDGTRCVASTGTVPTVGGVNLSYHCTGGVSAALTSTHGPRWAAVDARPDAAVLHRTLVTGAWRS